MYYYPVTPGAYRAPPFFLGLPAFLFVPVPDTLDLAAPATASMTTGAIALTIDPKIPLPFLGPRLRFGFRPTPDIVIKPLSASPIRLSPFSRTGGTAGWLLNLRPGTRGYGLP